MADFDLTEAIKAGGDAMCKWLDELGVPGSWMPTLRVYGAMKAALDAAALILELQVREKIALEIESAASARETWVAANLWSLCTDELAEIELAVAATRNAAQVARGGSDG